MAGGLSWCYPVRAFYLVLLCGTAAALGSRCNREPEEARSTQRTPADGRFSLRISGNPDKYVPGEKYTVSLEGARTPQGAYKFTGFMLVVDSVGGNEHGSNDAYGLSYAGMYGAGYGGGGSFTEDSYSGHSKPYSPLGNFNLFGDALTKFSERCPNMVTQTSSLPKTEIQVVWTAPAAGSGCVAFRATVVESRDVWYMDEGSLTVKLCEAVQENPDEQPEVVDPCCACDEAKYEVVFEGLWSRHTHPKDFPTNSWLTRFSDVIGASHSADYRFWEYGEIASDGLKNVAEKGSTRMLESELKAQSEHIRTIIKARGISYPNVTGKTFAVFRVDKKHHLMSLVSMIDPSPDWIVGVSGLELCLSNCSWVESLKFNLYPWDAGTDNGLTYMSPDSPTIPREPIRKLSRSYPNDERSPFFDSSGSEMKPLARLYLSRQRLYEKTCGPPDGIEDDSRPECAVGEWNKWSPCSVSCGRGVRNRQRYFLNVHKAQVANCQQKLSESMACLGKEHHCEKLNKTNDDLGNPWCAVSSWGEWSSCSATCGRGGERTRSRRLMSRLGRKKCRSHPPLSETQPCPQPLPPCQYEDEETIPPDCRVGQWSDWSTCSVTCGKGVQRRTRMVHKFSANGEEEEQNEDEEDDDDEDGYSEGNEDGDECSKINRNQVVECQAEEPSCDMDPEQAREACSQEKLVGPCRGYFPRWHFDKISGSCQQFIYGGCRQNKNNFMTKEECESVCDALKAPGRPDDDLYGGLEASNHLQVPLEKSIYRKTDLYPTPTMPTPTTTPFFLLTTNDGPIVDCKVTRWSKWSECSATCGHAWREKWRDILVNPKNGGKRCPTKLLKRNKCRLPPCDSVEDLSGALIPTWGDPDGTDRAVAVDCILGEWSQWSPCSQSCGLNAVQQRTRSLLMAPGPLGKPCEHRLEYRSCVLLPCLLHPRL